ncbi:hypothetical protein KP509_19G008800 [Ceratopteris richardii]|uniref:RWD domain-containing protein n=1 Tax=Ceratopteris richardii TaxID=49495 RepID=A0A8T2SJL9_CERRI|nr:hypothetical protein KP509_19G008800 [Ceratopteris richardii]
MAGGSRRKRTGQRKNKKSFARQSAKEHSLSHPQNESSLSDELTALSSIFQEDFTLISEDSFTEFSIALRPHADADGSNVYAELHVRCLPGYPNKPPKLQIKCEKGLSTEDVHSLHSLLVDQATSVSREGRVMIYNLVETATEFLSEHNESELLYGHEDISIEESTPSITPPKEASIFQDGRGPFVHGLIDLFYEPGNEGLWTGNHPAIKQEGLAGNATAQNLFSSDNIDPVTLKRTSVISIAKDFEFRDPEQFFSRKPSNKHFSYDKEEELEDLDSSTQFPSVSEILERIYVGSDQKNLFPEEQSSGSSDNDRVPENKCSRLWERSGHSVHKDFLLAHLLGLVCSPRGLLPYAWPALASQLQRIDVIPQTIMDLVINQPQKFQMAFSEIFSDCITESLRGPSSAKSFWTGSEELLRTTDSIHTKGSSRYVSDFEELSVLGEIWNTYCEIHEIWNT